MAELRGSLQVDSKLHVTDSAHAAGKRICLVSNGMQLYPSLPVRVGTKLATDDQNFLLSRGELLNGRFQYQYANGKLRYEEVYVAGRLFSSKAYDKKGRLVEWFDYGSEFCGQRYSAFFQECGWNSKDESFSREGILCCRNGQWAVFKIDVACK